MDELGQRQHWLVKDTLLLSEKPVAVSQDFVVWYLKVTEFKDSNN
jgi:hypothetical protein